jgi:hypothetical protein
VNDLINDKLFLLRSMYIMKFKVHSNAHLEEIKGQMTMMKKMSCIPITMLQQTQCICLVQQVLLSNPMFIAYALSKVEATMYVFSVSICVLNFLLRYILFSKKCKYPI